MSESLTEDVLLQIFLYFNLKSVLRLKLVCRNWDRLIDSICKRKKTLIISQDLFNNFYPKHVKVETIVGFVDYYLKPYGQYIENVYFTNPENYSIFGKITRKVNDFVARYELDDRMMYGIVTYCINLHTLHIVKQIFDAYSTFARLGNLSKTLKSLRIELCRLDEQGDVDKSVDAIFKICSNLEEFSLRGSCYGYLELTDKALISIPTSIKSLDLSASFSVTIADVQWLQNVNYLSELYLERTNFDNSDLRLLINSCRKSLKILTLSFTQRITNFEPLGELDLLIYLKLDGNRDNFDDRALISVCQNCKNLKSLLLENCRLLTSDGLKSIANLHNLKHLDLCSISNVDDRCLNEIFKYCIRLEIVELKFCRRITKDGLEALKYLPNLKSVGCPFTGKDLNKEDFFESLINS